MVDSLKGGLLPALVSITQRERVPHYANRILEVALPSSLIRYRAVVQAGISISPALTIMKNLVDIQKVPESLKFFLRILSDRLIVKEDYESGKSVSTQACDNMEVSQSLLALTENGYKVYASVGCSCVDLKSENAAVVQGDTTVPSNVKKLTGAKRDIGACETFRKCTLAFLNHVSFSPVLSILTAKSDDASTLDRIFMRLVVHHGYESSKESLFRRQILFMHENPNTDFYCLYNFKNGLPSFGVYPVRDLPRVDPVWVDSINRARRSGGRMEIHLVEVPDGAHDDLANGTRGNSRIFPLRSSRADIQRGLRAIASTLPATADESTLDPEIQARVQTLLRMTRDVVQIHSE
jgi:hypothetical protein